MSDDDPRTKYPCKTADELEDIQWPLLTNEQRIEKLEKLLADNSFGRLRDEHGHKYELSKSRVATTLKLIDKYKADLKSVELSGEVRNIDITDQPLTADEWSEQYATH